MENDKQYPKGKTVVAEPMWERTGDLKADNLTFRLWVAITPAMFTIMESTYPGGLTPFTN